MESVLSSVLWRLFKWLPAILLKRVFSIEWMKRNIYIDIRPRHASVEIIQPDNPRVNIYLDIRNNTHFDIEIDRILLSFTYGSEIATPQHFKREYIKSGDSTSIYFTSRIDYINFQNLAFQHQKNSNHCHLKILTEINTRLHSFCIEKTLDGIKPEISNSNLLEEAKEE